MAQGQDEFYFALSYDLKMDIALVTYNNGEPSTVLAAELNISVEQAELIYRDIDAKRKTTAVLLACNSGGNGERPEIPSNPGDRLPFSWLVIYFC